MLSMAGRKRPFKIDFNRCVDEQWFHGLRHLNPHNNEELTNGLNATFVPRPPGAATNGSRLRGAKEFPITR
jgi:hypothetical protein